MCICSIVIKDRLHVQIIIRLSVSARQGPGEAVKLTTDKGEL